jgi:hypothetical protein
MVERSEWDEDDEEGKKRAGRDEKKFLSLNCHELSVRCEEMEMDLKKKRRKSKHLRHGVALRYT